MGGAGRGQDGSGGGGGAGALYRGGQLWAISEAASGDLLAVWTE